MDPIHVVIVGMIAIALIVLAFLVWAAIEIGHTVATVDDNAKKIAEMANRNERMTMEVLKKVYDVQSPQA